MFQIFYKQTSIWFSFIIRCFCLFIFNICDRILPTVQKLKMLKFIYSVQQMALSLCCLKRNSNNNLLNMKTRSILLKLDCHLDLHICYPFLVTLNAIKFRPTEKTYFKIAPFTLFPFSSAAKSFSLLLTQVDKVFFGTPYFAATSLLDNPFSRSLSDWHFSSRVLNVFTFLCNEHL